MKKSLFALLGLLSFGAVASAQTTLLTYQGSLSDSGSPANGNYDVKFTLHDTPTLTNQVGNAIVVAPLTVSNGLFKATLDFGNATFNGSNRWLQVAVRPFGNTNLYSVLTPRQQVTSTPYAIQALNAASADAAATLSVALPGTNVSGTIPVSNLPTNVALLNTNANFGGTVTATQFNGSGAGLFNVPAAGLLGTIPDARLSTNVALLNTNANFNGTVSATNFYGYGGGLTNVPGRLFDNIPTGSAIQAQANTGYLATNDTVAVVVTLPLSANIRVGETVRVSGSGAGGWIIAQNDGQSIIVANLLDGIVNWTARENNRSWRAVASSTDGTKLVAAVNGGLIYTSTNSGATWVGRTTSGNRNWQSVASSGDGTKLVTVVNPGYIFTSTDSGANWTLQSSSGSRAWTAVASSLDGVHLTATASGASGGRLYTSPDSGASWTPRDVVRYWNSVASSADGSNLVATAGTGNIYTSTNGGLNWRTNATVQNWSWVASSYDGGRLAAVAYNGQIYISSDHGLNWAPTASSDSWTTISSSADGARLVAASNLGAVYVSTDSGATWSMAVGPPSDSGWTSVAFSGDGSTAAAVATPGFIYVSSHTSTTLGTTGYLSGTRLSAVDLEYIGNGQFMPVTQIGTIRAY